VLTQEAPAQISVAPLESIDSNLNVTKRPTLPGYISPSLELVHYPLQPNLFDGFVVSGRAIGSELYGAFVYVTVAGVTRRAKIIDGLWTAIFEDDSLPKHYSGNKEIVAQVRDSLGHIARTSVEVTIEDFVDSFVTIDGAHTIVGIGADAELITSGELNLGSHLEGRELIVLLVRDDEEACVVATGTVAKGWHHGEWRARISLAGIKSGAFRVRAQLMDCANAALTRVMTSSQVILI